MEEWRPIRGFETQYAVSSMGGVKSLSRVVSNGFGFRKIPEKVMSLERHYRGYLRVSLFTKSESRHAFVHRLVADAFLPAAHTTEVVNHKNGDKTDNRVENLEWATVAENTQHYYTFLRPEKVPKLPVDEPFDPADLPF